MNLSDFEYDLPRELIAQEPLEPRDASRLLVVPPGSGPCEHWRFRDLGRFLAPGDVLVINDTRVVAARFFGVRSSGGRIEVLLLERRGTEALAMVRSRRRLRAGERIPLDRCALEVRALARREDGLYRLELICGADLDVELERGGKLPLPPYIHRARGVDRRDGVDRERYQTVYGRVDGAVAAPTAGLHFTPALMRSLERGGVDFIPLTLHVGLGTFEPVRVQRIEDHQMHAEFARLPAESARRLAAARARGGRIVAVGTTAVRVLESARRAAGSDQPWEGMTDLFLRPGEEIPSIDALITNFHLPASTLLMLVSCFRGRERILAAYAEAIDRGYRFFSYGDATLLL